MSTFNSIETFDLKEKPKSIKGYVKILVVVVLVAVLMVVAHIFTIVSVVNLQKQVDKLKTKNTKRSNVQVNLSDVDNMKNRMSELQNVNVAYRNKVRHLLRVEMLRAQELSVNWLVKQHWVANHTSGFIASQIALTELAKKDVSQRLGRNKVELEAHAVEMFNSSKVDQLPYFIMGIKSACENPANFSGFDFVKKLKNNMKNKVFEGYAYSLGIITLYTVNMEVSSKLAEKIVERVNETKKRNDLHDSDAMNIIAFEALVRQNPVLYAQTKYIIKEIIDEFFKSGRYKTSNVDTVAHLIQAYDAINGPYNFSRDEVILWILEHQDRFGSFGGIMGTTANVVAALGRKSLLDLKCLCPSESSCATKKILVSLQIDLGSIRFNETCNCTKVESQNGTLAIDEKSTALEVIQHMNDCYHPKVKETSYGKQLTTICGIEANHAKKSYWAVAVNGKAAMVGPGKLVMKDNDKLKFTYTSY